MQEIRVISEMCFSDVLLESATEIFETMVFISLEKNSELNEKIEGDSLLASITFKGDLEGCFAICCSLSCARAIATSMLGIESDGEIQQGDITDAIGEVANMVIGGIKKRVLESVGSFTISIPTVVGGQELESSISRTNKVSVGATIEHNYTARFSLWYREPSGSLRRNGQE
jgi:chemotaxis protein CheX